ncbi:tetratricopeptide repeat protein [Rubellimicrobium arenae]|uniref:tetratricopeptide repeat protein n=1 Tax=Rubellimicrobium arenae TaxID=2817372 RepID=UPI003F5E558D
MRHPDIVRRTILALLLLTALPACTDLASPGVFAPGPGREADPLVAGHRLMTAGEYQLALKAYLRAAAREGLTPDVLAAIGTADLRLGRLGQAEGYLRQAVEEDPGYVSAWNNLGVLLMERQDYGEAAEVFRRAYAADNGNSDTIRDNLRLALARMKDPAYSGVAPLGEDTSVATAQRHATDTPLPTTPFHILEASDGPDH